MRPWIRQRMQKQFDRYSADRNHHHPYLALLGRGPPDTLIRSPCCHRNKETTAPLVYPPVGNRESTFVPTWPSSKVYRHRNANKSQEIKSDWPVAPPLLNPSLHSEILLFYLFEEDEIISSESMHLGRNYHFPCPVCRSCLSVVRQWGQWKSCRINTTWLSHKLKTLPYRRYRI